MSDSYLPLTLKYRPQTFSDLVGQEVTVRTITNMIKTGRIHPSNILGGSRGIGKTTTARIIAKALNCEERQPNGDPCNACKSCREIQSETSFAVREMDAASHGLVDDIRKIRDDLQYTATGEKYRVYIVDEAHSLSKQAWEAFLKLLEEPPEHVIFIFCSTELHKFPDTIVSRSVNHVFSRQTVENIVKRLTWIAECESIQIDPAALHTIARHVQGGMRDAISLLDQLVSFVSGKRIEEEDVDALIGTVNRELLFTLNDALTSRDIKQVFTLLQKAYTEISDVNVLIDELLNFYRDMLLEATGVEVRDVPPQYRQRLTDSAKKVTVEHIVHCQNQLVHIGEQVRRGTLPARAVVDTGMVTLLYGGLPQSGRTMAQAAPLPVVPTNGKSLTLSPEEVAGRLGGKMLRLGA